MLALFLSLASCEKDSTIENDFSTKIQYENSTIFKSGESIEIVTGKSPKKINTAGIFVDSSIEVKNGTLSSKNDFPIWYIPVDKRETPVKLNNTGKILYDPNPIIACDCSAGMNLCEVKTTKTETATVITCQGVCATTTEDTVICAMSITIPNGKEIITKEIINGIIVSSKTIIVNGKQFK